jgi:Family of unknown function (DUF6152)
MENRRLLLSAAAVVLSIGTLSAHHGAAGYDNKNITVLKGTITEWIWRNPHSEVRFDVTDAKGEVRHWSVEAPPPTMLTERGWTKASLKPGETLTFHINAAMNGAPVGILRKVVLANGQDLWAYPPAELLQELTTRAKQ